MDHNPFSRLLSIEEAAGYFHVSKSYLYKKTMSREIPFLRLGRAIFFLRDEIEEYFLHNCKVEAVNSGYRHTLISVEQSNG